MKSFAGLAGVLILAVALSPTAADGSRIFLQAGNLTDILRQISVIGIIALAMTFVILTAGIDLSVGSILALATSVVAIRSLAQAPASATRNTFSPRFWPRSPCLPRSGR